MAKVSFESSLRRGRIVSFWVGYSALLIFTILALVNYFASTGGLSQELTVVIVFYGLLPLINAVIDWVSLGVTRGLLQAIRSGHHSAIAALAWALSDLLLALVFLLLISLLMVAAVQLTNHVAEAGGGKAVIDLGVLFAAIRKDPFSPDHYWIYFMLLSTLIPTLLHFALAGVAAVLCFPGRVRRWILDKWDEGDGEAKDRDVLLLGWAYTSLMPVIGFIVAPASLLAFLYWATVNFGDDLGGCWLQLMEYVAGV